MHFIHIQRGATKLKSEQAWRRAEHQRRREAERRVVELKQQHGVVHAENETLRVENETLGTQVAELQRRAEQLEREQKDLWAIMEAQDMKSFEEYKRTWAERQPPSAQAAVGAAAVGAQPLLPPVVLGERSNKRECSPSQLLALPTKKKQRGTALERQLGHVPRRKKRSRAVATAKPLEGGAEQQHKEQERRTSPKRSSFRCVYRNTSRGPKPWSAKLCHNGKTSHLGSFCSEIEAAKAWDAAARKVGRQDLNFPQPKLQEKKEEQDEDVVKTQRQKKSKAKRQSPRNGHQKEPAIPGAMTIDLTQDSGSSRWGHCCVDARPYRY